MTAEELAAIIVMSLLSTVVVVAVAAIVLRVSRRLPLWAQLGVLLVATVLSVVISMVAVANQMYLSAHDLTVAVNTTIVSGLVSLLLIGAMAALALRRFRGLARAVMKLGYDETIDLIGRQPSREFQVVADQLQLTSLRLVESRAREARIEGSRRELAAWISHDLRTPLAGILSMAEALQDGVVESRERYYERIAHQARQLSGMVDDLFELSKIDSGVLELRADRVSLREIAEDAVAEHQPLASRRVMRIEADGDADVEVIGDERELLRAVSNLLANAIQHTPDGTPIGVIVASRDGAPSVSVVDSGGGIADADLARIFDPGWRGHSARSAGGRSSGGAGLGLAIVRGILRAHGGEVAVANVGGGCRFDLLLPAGLLVAPAARPDSSLNVR